MTRAAMKRELDERFESLPLDQQQRLLQYARTLDKAPLRGTPGRDLLRFAGRISAEDAREIMQAVREDCEGIDPDA